MNTNTLLASNIFFFYSSLLYPFLSNEKVLYDHNCNCFSIAGGVFEVSCMMSAVKVVN